VSRPHGPREWSGLVAAGIFGFVIAVVAATLLVAGIVAPINAGRAAVP
jgi:tetrahydromethanopterin S-methyltransferase subunit F